MGEIAAEKGDILYLNLIIRGEKQTAYAFTKSFKDYDFSPCYQATLSKSEKRGERYYTKLEIKSKNFLRMAHISADAEADYSDNWFDVLPGEKKTVEIVSKTPVDRVQIKDYTEYAKGNAL